MRSNGLMFIALLAGAVCLAGCPDPKPELAVSSHTHHFWGDHYTGNVETKWQFQVWNSGDKDSELIFEVHPVQPWIKVSPAQGISRGENERININVTLDREHAAALKGVPSFATGYLIVNSTVESQSLTLTTVPDYYTEVFNNYSRRPIDLAHTALTFRPSDGLSYYAKGKTANVTALPSNPENAMALDFSIADPYLVVLPGEWRAGFYGVQYDRLYISSKGYVGIGSPGKTPQTIGDHFTAAQISALPVDAAANPETALVTFGLDHDKAYITYEDVASSAARPDTSNTFQIELFADETVRLSYLEIDPDITGVVGLSTGGGDGVYPPQPDFVLSDLSDANTAPLQATY